MAKKYKTKELRNAFLGNTLNKFKNKNNHENSIH